MLSKLLRPAPKQQSQIRYRVEAEVQLLPRFAGEQGQVLPYVVEKIVEEDLTTMFQGIDWTGYLKASMLEKAGRTGLDIDGRFYPHSRIDFVRILNATKERF